MGNWNNRLVGALAIAALVLGLGSINGPTTRAVFNDTGDSSSNTFSSGLVDLTLAGLSDNVIDTVQMAVNMVPGDVSTAPAGGLEVRNNNATGKAVAMRYALTSIVEGAGSTVLTKRLDLVAGKRAATGTCSSASTFGTTEAVATEWVLVYQGDLADSTATEMKLIGDKAAGQHAFAAWQQSGDRALAVAASEWLCFRVTFKNNQDGAAADAATGERGTTAHNYVQDDADATTDNPYKNLSGDVKFTFHAEQTANN